MYNEQDTSKMPLELGSALSIEREPATDTEIRIQALEAVYLIILYVGGYFGHFVMLWVVCYFEVNMGIVW